MDDEDENKNGWNIIDFKIIRIIHHLRTLEHIKKMGIDLGGINFVIKK